MSNLFEELKRRHVVKVGLAYFVIAFGIVEITSYLLENVFIDAPGWINTAVGVLFIIGFPTTILLAWIYDLSFKGIVKTQPLETPAKEQAASIADGEPGYLSLSESRKLPKNDKSLAILPLTNLSPVDENAFFADGIHEEILNQLSKVSDLRVISRTATQQFRNTMLTPREIAEKLGVSQIMEGSVRFFGNLVRVIIQLVHASDNSQIWSERYERELDDIFSIQSTIAIAVANAMQADLKPEEIENIKRPATQNIKAYTLFLRAITREKHGNSNLAKESGGWVEDGLEDLEEALQLDPDFARAYAHKGWLQILKRFIVFPHSGTELLRDAKANAEKALEIDPNVIRAYSVLAFAAFECHKWEEWEELDRKAISFPDAKAGTFLNFAERLGRKGRFEEAWQFIDRSIALDPLRTQTREFATYYRLLGKDYESALTMIEYFQASGGREDGYHLYRAVAYVFMNDLENAKTEMNSFSGDFTALIYNMPILYAFAVARLGGKDEILKQVKESKSEVERAFKSFGCALGCSDLDTAFFILDNYMKSGHVVSDLGPLFEEIKLDPRWQIVEDYLNKPVSI